RSIRLSNSTACRSVPPTSKLVIKWRTLALFVLSTSRGAASEGSAPAMSIKAFVIVQSSSNRRGFGQSIESHALGPCESRLRHPANERASPKFQYEQAPAMARVVTRAAPVFVQDRQDRPVIEIAALARSRAPHCVVQHLAQLAVKPSADRHVEA